MSYVLTDFFNFTIKITKNYVQKTKTYSTLRFIFELTFVALIGKMVIGMFGFFITSIVSEINFNELPTRGLKNPVNPAFVFILYCVIAPIFETIILQWLPIKLLQKITSSIALVVIIDAILFTLAHWNLGFNYMMFVFFPGIVFAWSFTLNNNSFWKAFGITASIHSLCNFSAVVGILFL